MAEITTLVNFNFANGEHPVGSLVEDAAGDLFGTAATTSSSGTQTEQVFEIANTARGYASAPTILATFDDNSFLSSGLTIDVAGDLFAQTDGADDASTNLYEIAKTGGGYAAPNLLTNVAGEASGNVVINAAGDLILATTATTWGGVNVYELAVSGAVYSGSATTIAALPANGTNYYAYGPSEPELAQDSAGDLFITALSGGYSGIISYANGAVFEIAATPTGYASTAQLLATVTSSESTEGANSSVLSGLMVDEAGDIVGGYWTPYTASTGMFQIAKTAAGYADDATFLPASPTADGQTGTIAEDAKGDLFGAAKYTEYSGGSVGDGVVYAELLGADGSYTEQDLATFDGTNGSQPNSVLIGPGGELYGTTEYGGLDDDGTLFQVDIAQLPSLSITGVSVASAGQLTVSGTIDLGDADLTVSIYEGDELLGTATPGANGDWSVTVAQTTLPGETNLEAAATNALGGVGSVAVDLFYDTNNQWGATSGANGAVYLDNAQVSVTAGGASVYFGGAGDWVSLYNTSGAWDTVRGDDGSVILTGAQASILGSADQIYFNSQSPSAVSLYDTKGNWDKTTGDDGSLTLVNAQVSVFGGYEKIYLDGSADDAASLYATNGQWDTVFGDDGAVTLNGAEVSVFGQGDFVYFAPGTHNQASLYNTDGSPDSVVGSDSIVIFNGAQGSVSGGSNVLYFWGADDAADLYATAGGWDTLLATGGSVTLHGAQVSVWGGNDRIAFAADANNAASLYNTGDEWDTVTGDDGAVTLNSAQVSVLGGGDYIYGGGGVANPVNAVSVYQTNGNQDFVFDVNGGINLTNAQASIYGGGDVLYLSGASTAAMTGANETFVFQAAIGEATIGGFVSSDVIQFSSADFANYQALAGHISQSGDDAVITYDANDKVTLTNYSASSLTAANFKFA